MEVRHVGQRLERRAAFQEEVPEPVLVAGGTGDHVAHLRRYRPCGLARRPHYLAVVLGIEAVRARKKVWFMDCARLVADFRDAQPLGILKKRLNTTRTRSSLS